MSLNDENSKTVYQELFVVTGFLIVERMFYLPSYDQVFTMLQCFLCETSEQLGPCKVKNSKHFKMSSTSVRNV